MDFKTIFTNENNEDFIDLAKELWDEYYENVGNTVDKYREVNNLEGEHFVILIFDENSENNSPIACGSFKEFSPDTVEIKRVFVKKTYRNKGLATFIMKRLEKEAKNRSYNFSVLVTGTNNLPSQVFYKKLDYDTFEGFGFFKGDFDSISFKKEL
ncbi:MAG: GNAT family N-acetyltransferase [Methanobacteriaceae archaeon]|jgi:GNAT superfamily N-acetyltransferase|nr:GNAT family N-acetyltransferase [Candidatus Methanorudis spinitermitis]